MEKIKGTNLFYNNNMVLDSKGKIQHGIIKIDWYGGKPINVSIDWLILMHKFKIHSVNDEVNLNLHYVRFVKHKRTTSDSCRCRGKPDCGCDVDAHTIYLDKPIKIGDGRVLARFPNYTISQHGTVTSLANGTSRHEKDILNKSKKYSKHNKYPFVYIYDPRLGSSQKIYLHIIKAIAWIRNDDWVNKTVVNHIDHNKFNPSLDNLSWETPSSNTLLYYEHINKLKQ